MSKGSTLVLAVLLISTFGVNTAVTARAAEDKPPEKYTEIVTAKNGDKVSFEMVRIPGGTLLMGSPADESGAKDDERPQHEVRVDPLYLCATEVTLELFLAYYEETVTAKKDHTETEKAAKEAEQEQADVDAFTSPTAVYGDLTMGYGKRHPAMGMTWHNAQNFCKWLSIKTGKKYRLPTEAEWEHACRSGSTGVFSCTNDANQVADSAWYKANSDGETHAVGKKKPNAWGLYDMMGNVREWVHDFYSPEGYKSTAKKNPAVNPRGPTSGKVHVARGGDFRSSPQELRCAARAFEQKWWRSGDPQIPKSKWWLPGMEFIGFRIARSIDLSEKCKKS